MRIVFSVLSMMMFFSGAAEASTYVWKDDAEGFSISFPDTWAEIGRAHV